MNLRVWFFALVVVPWPVLGQDGGKGDEEKVEKRPPRVVRFLAVGEKPPYEIKTIDGVAYEQPPPEGSVPPSEVSVGVPKEDGEEELGKARLELRRVSLGVKIPAGAGPLLLRKIDESGDSKPWLKLERPEEGDLLVVVWRDPRYGTWDKALGRVLSAGKTAGEVSLVNVASGPVAVVYGKKKHALRPLEVVREKLPPGKPVTFQLGLPDGEGGISRQGRELPLEQQEGEASLLILYQADRKDPRQFLKWFQYRDRVAASGG